MNYRKDFRYENADFNSDFPGNLNKARDWLRTYRTKKNNLFICGPTGCGKTYLIMAFLNKLCEYYKKYTTKTSDFWDITDVEYVVSKELFSTIKKQFSNSISVSEDAQNEIYNIKNIKLLIIDEFGLGYGTDSELIELTDILDYRWRKGFPTVFISNLSMKGIAEYLRNRATQRAFDGADYLEEKELPSLRQKPKEL